MSAVDLTGAEAIHPDMVFYLKMQNSQKLLINMELNLLGLHANIISKWEIKLKPSE